MALAGLFAGTTVTKLPQRVCAVSSCYRAEEAKNRVDKDFYRCVSLLSSKSIENLC